MFQQKQKSLGDIKLFVVRNIRVRFDLSIPIQPHLFQDGADWGIVGFDDKLSVWNLLFNHLFRNSIL